MEVYVERLRHFIQKQRLLKVRLTHPFLLRTANPPIQSVEGLCVVNIKRIGKRIALELEEEFFLILHLMISGRLLWRTAGCKIPPKRGLGAFDFPNGTLLITEASSKKRASLHLIRGQQQLLQFDRGGLEIPDSTLEDFRLAITAENHTLKRALTDPRILSGIGNAYSDEILHRAKLSPVTLTDRLTEVEIEQLHSASKEILLEWTERLRQEIGEGFPERVTSQRRDMAVHGRYGQPCPVCNTAVQRIRYATRETNYCPTCQTGGRLLADRSLSRLLKKDWPRTIEELEERSK